MENRSARSSCISSTDKDEEGKNFQREVPPSQEGLAHECKRCKVKPQKAFRTTTPPDTHWLGDWLGLGVNLNASEKKNLLSTLGIKP